MAAGTTSTAHYGHWIAGYDVTPRGGTWLESTRPSSVAH
jgi:hypothetical protein